MGSFFSRTWQIHHSETHSQSAFVRPSKNPFPRCSIDARPPKRCVFMRFKYCVSSLLCRQTIHQQRLLVCRRFYEVILVAVRKSLVKCFMMRVSSSRLFYKTHRCQRPLKLNFRLKLKAAVADVVPNRSCQPGIRGDISRGHHRFCSKFTGENYMLIRTCKFR